MSDIEGAGTTQNTGTDNTGTILTDGLADAQGKPPVTTQPPEGGTPQGEGQKTDAEGAKPEDKKGEDTKAAGVPETYDFKLPEGIELDSKLAEKATPLLKEMQVTQENATKLAALLAEHMTEAGKAAAAAQAEAWQGQLADWQKEIKEDKEFGGQNYEATKKAAQTVIARFGDDQLREDLVKLGIGNLPSLIRAFARAGKNMAEDKFHNASGTSVSTEDRLANMYPSMAKKA